MCRKLVAVSMLGLGCALGSGDGEAGSAGLGGDTDASGSGDSRGTGDSGQGASDPSGDVDATAAPDSSATNDPSDGPGAVCGDGTTDPGEDCDDGNEMDGDGCNVDCRGSGALDWEHLESGTLGQDDEIWDIAHAQDGGAYVVGQVRNADGTVDGWVRKINPLGGMLWTATHDGPANGNDAIRGVALSTGGLFVVAGYHSVTGQGANVWVRQYDEAGDPQWTDTFDGSASSSDAANGLAVDPFGDILVVGHTTTTSGARDVLLRKYTPDGAVAWTRTYDGAAGDVDHGWGVATALGGEIYAAGWESVPGEGKNSWLGKYDIDGNLLWSRVVNGGEGLDDELRGVAVTEGGPVVCGFESGVDVPWQSFVRKYDEAGTIVWTERYTGATGEGALCNAIAGATGGDFVWTGGELVAGIREIVVRKLDSEGNVRWTTRVPAAAEGGDQGRGIDVAADGKIFVGGRKDAGVDGLDVWAGGFTP